MSFQSKYFLFKPVLMFLDTNQNFKLIFHGSSASDKAPGRGSGKKKCNAEIHRLSGATPRTIAYAAVHVCEVWLYNHLLIIVQSHMAMSSSSGWRRFDGDFDYKQFYNLIVDLFEGPLADPVWAKHTLQWWNKYVKADFMCS